MVGDSVEFGGVSNTNSNILFKIYIYKKYNNKKNTKKSPFSFPFFGGFCWTRRADPCLVSFFFWRYCGLLEDLEDEVLFFVWRSCSPGVVCKPIARIALCGDVPPSTYRLLFVRAHGVCCCGLGVARYENLMTIALVQERVGEVSPLAAVFHAADWVVMALCLSATRECLKRPL